MTNKEKFKEVFGFYPETCGCIAEKCEQCPLYVGECTIFKGELWWKKEYKEASK